MAMKEILNRNELRPTKILPGLNSDQMRTLRAHWSGFYIYSAGGFESSHPWHSAERDLAYHYINNFLDDFVVYRGTKRLSPDGTSRGDCEKCGLDWLDCPCDFGIETIVMHDQIISVDRVRLINKMIRCKIHTLVYTLNDVNVDVEKHYGHDADTNTTWWLYDGKIVFRYGAGNELRVDDHKAFSMWSRNDLINVNPGLLRKRLLHKGVVKSIYQCVLVTNDAQDLVGPLANYSVQETITIPLIDFNMNWRIKAYTFTLDRALFKRLLTRNLADNVGFDGLLEYARAWNLTKYSIDGHIVHKHLVSVDDLYAHVVCAKMATKRLMYKNRYISNFTTLSYKYGKAVGQILAIGNKVLGDMFSNMGVEIMKALNIQDTISKMDDSMKVHLASINNYHIWDRLLETVPYYTQRDVLIDEEFGINIDNVPRVCHHHKVNCSHTDGDRRCECCDIACTNDYCDCCKSNCVHNCQHKCIGEHTGNEMCGCCGKAMTGTCKHCHLNVDLYDELLEDSEALTNMTFSDHLLKYLNPIVMPILLVTRVM
jgi:hypothetical protein